MKLQVIGVKQKMASNNIGSHDTSNSTQFFRGQRYGRRIWIFFCTKVNSLWASSEISTQKNRDKYSEELCYQIYYLGKNDLQIMKEKFRFYIM